MSRELKGAIAGFGQVAEKAHAQALKAVPRLKIAAVAEASPARRQAAAAAFPAAKTYETLETLLASEKGLDFVIIATPPSSHGELVLRALKAGCHALCEKPLALELEQFEAIKREAGARDLCAYTMHNWAHAPQWRKIFALVEAGALGELRHAELHVLRSQPAASAVPGDWRSNSAVAGGGILVDHGWHNLYLLHRLLPGSPARATARLGGAKAGALEHDATVFLEYAGATALLHLTWRAGLRANTAIIYGSKGALRLEDDRLVLQTAGGEERFDFPEKLSGGSAHPDWTASLLEDFAGAVDAPADRARNLEEAAFCVKMINRIYASVRHGRSPAREATSRPREVPRT